MNMHDKKAIISFNTLQFVLRLFFLIIVTLAIVTLSRAYFNMNFDVFNQETTLFYNRLYFDRNLVYTDPITDRIYPGIFVKEQMNDRNLSGKLSDSIFYGETNEHIAAQIQLKTDKEEMASFFNPGSQRGYDEWILLAKSGIPGPGGVSLNRFVLPNALSTSRDRAKYEISLLNVTVVMRNG